MQRVFTFADGPEVGHLNSSTETAEAIEKKQKKQYE